MKAYILQSPWRAKIIASIRSTRKDVIADFEAYTKEPWSEKLKEGWRVVRCTVEVDKRKKGEF